MSYIRQGDYIVQVSPAGQFKDALWCLVFAFVIPAILFAIHPALLMVAIPLALFFIYSAWRAMVNWWRVLGAEGEAIYGKHK